ncbi:hypothetical protein MMC22_007759 [Lobaria immixta]|nr:hypothetical protein [Lobaria immixta]
MQVPSKTLVKLLVYLEKPWLMHCSSTCGARWRSCTCAETEQARIKAEIAERFAKFDAEDEAEEAAAREADAAFKGAEGQLDADAVFKGAEGRVAADLETEGRDSEETVQGEELDELAKVESARVEDIHDYYALLRAALEKVIQQQRQAIRSRHESDILKLEKEETDLSEANVCKERSRQVTVERAHLVASNEKKIVELRRQHRDELMHTLQRHRDDQDAVFLQPIRGPEIHRGLLTESALEALLEVQETERKTMQTQHEAEMAKWRARGIRALEEFDAIMREEQARFAKVHLVRVGDVRRALEAARRSAASDWKWFNQLVHARDVMIDEDERRMVMSGADAPALPAQCHYMVMSGPDATVLPVRDEKHGMMMKSGSDVPVPPARDDKLRMMMKLGSDEAPPVPPPRAPERRMTKSGSDARLVPPPRAPERRRTVSGSDAPPALPMRRRDRQL